jgi:polyisoprenoid-binding protein YceI
MSTWKLDPTHTRIGFSVRHMGFSKVHGRFARYDAAVELSGEDLTSATASASIDVDSIATDNDQRDAHLRNNDFFDAPNHPKIEWKSTGIRQEGERLLVDGDITIRGTTRPITLSVDEFGRGKDPWGNERISLTARGRIPSRKEFGVAFNAVLETGSLMVGDAVDLELDLEAVKVA